MKKKQEIKLETCVEPESSNKPKNLMNLVFLSIALITCLGLLLHFYYEKDPAINNFITTVKNRILDTSSTSIGSIQYQSGTYPVTVPYGDGLACVMNDGLKMYNLQGQEEWKDPEVLPNSMVKVGGRYMITVDKGGKNLSVYKSKNKMWTQSVDGEILNVSINEKGYVGVIYKDEKHKGIVKIFNDKGIEMLIRYYSNNYAVDVKVSPDNKIIAIGEVNVSGFKTTCGIRFIPMGSTQESGSFEEDSILAGMEFMGKNLIAVLDDKLLSIDQNGTKTVLNDFGENTVTHVKINEGKFIVKVQKANSIWKQSSNIEIFNKNGKSISSVDINHKIISIDSVGDIIALNSGDKVTFLNSSGNQISQFSPKKDVKDVKLLKDGSAAAVVYINSLEIVNIY